MIVYLLLVLMTPIALAGTVHPGIDVLLATNMEALADKKIVLVTHAAARTGWSQRESRRSPARRAAEVA